LVELSADIYKEIILDYYKNPKNKGSLPSADVTVRDSNPLCGDVIEMQMKFSDGKISDIKFNGDGCAISQASASILTEMVFGKSIEEARAVTKEELLENLGSPNLGPVRIKCALLGLKVMKTGVYEKLGRELGSDDPMRQNV
jgi:nitrogen fixation protein NifU and related proteins